MVLLLFSLLRFTLFMDFMLPCFKNWHEEKDVIDILGLCGTWMLHVSSKLVLPVVKPRVKRFPNREYRPFLYQCF